MDSDIASSISTLICERQIQLELRAQNAAETMRALGGLLRANPAVLDADKLCAYKDEHRLHGSGGRGR